MTDAIWTAHVQQSQEAGGETNTYTLPADEMPRVETLGERGRELWLSRLDANGAGTVIAIYAQGSWSRVWLEVEQV